MYHRMSLTNLLTSPQQATSALNPLPPYGRTGEKKSQFDLRNINTFIKNPFGRQYTKLSILKRRKYLSSFFSAFRFLVGQLSKENTSILQQTVNLLQLFGFLVRSIDKGESECTRSLGVQEGC